MNQRIQLSHLLILIIFNFLFFNCGGGSKSKVDEIKSQSFVAPQPPKSLAEAEANWKDYPGIGPVKTFELPAKTDDVLVASGMVVFEAKCTACHKINKKYVGPDLSGVTTRRTPSWIMNMILNPEEMVLKDPIAKQLLMEYNGSPMANQNLTNDEARAVLEYFRTL
ncbi:MAG: cytochrome c [Cyclobacteriaceae bacterium]|jgi:cytochrome c